ncbi:conserved Plasmodium protein, unknown function [Plasmodium malariae]|nr:conserved Plasmodium protein, unknown function [Plasmodium malariae]
MGSDGLVASSSHLNNLNKNNAFYSNISSGVIGNVSGVGKMEQGKNLSCNSLKRSSQVVVGNTNLSNPFNYNGNSHFPVGGQNDTTKNELNEMVSQIQFNNNNDNSNDNNNNNDSNKLNEIPFTNENEILFEQNYIQNNLKKRILFFNENFIKSLESINNHNLNSYNENRSTIYTFPCSEPFNNAIFYIKGIEECKNGDRFDVDNALYNKIILKNNTFEFTVLKNINNNEKINHEDIALDIYYPLLHVEKIKFRQPLTAEISNQQIHTPFELGKIPTVI